MFDNAINCLRYLLVVQPKVLLFARWMYTMQYIQNTLTMYNFEHKYTQILIRINGFFTWMNGVRWFFSFYFCIYRMQTIDKTNKTLLFSMCDTVVLWIYFILRLIQSEIITIWVR